MGISKITRNFQVTIPKDVRAVKNLREGDEILFVIDGNRVDMVKREDDVIERTKGLWSGMKETGIEYTRRLRKGWGKRRMK